MALTKTLVSGASYPSLFFTSILDTRIFLIYKVVRSQDQATVDWSSVFQDGPECAEVDFLIMNHPRKQLSAYKLSDFTLKGERSTTLIIDPTQDFVFQVIAREDKGPKGIDYKYR